MAGPGTPSTRTLLEDRSNPNRHLTVVESDSCDAAAANSRAGANHELAQAL
ncbi:hypothetical protein [Streptomyces sp. NPDC057686]|uniref:hypothetical protein n=1 Tax=Streptomyces sp. NPDC057686 TaxID=3346212 RepID=UPI00369DBB29